MTKSTSTFTIDRVGLTILLSTVAKFAGKATPYNLVDLVFEKGRLFANCFNGEAGIKAIVAASGGEDTQKIIFGVNVDLLNQIVGTMTGDIKMSVQDKKVLIKSGKASSSLSAVLGASLPAIETGNMTPIASISGEALLTVLNALQFAAVDNARPVLELILLEFNKEKGQIHGWTADGFAAAHMVAKAAEVKESCSVLLSNGSRFITSLTSLIAKEDQIQIMASPDKARVTFGIKAATAKKAMIVTTPTMENGFPLDAVKNLLGKKTENATATLDPKATTICVKQVEIMGKTGHLFTKVGEIHIESALTDGNEAGIIRNILETQNLVGEFDLMLNVSYVGKIAAIAGEGIVNFACSGPAQPVFFTAASFEAVMMPILTTTKKAVEEPVQAEATEASATATK